ncbi:MAG: exodeoxyribonuclease VII small subunit [Acidobacteria bacterium]|jgi:exodeoxyribonuclease VII small subunit|nr:MAG: exodeoxyribonuclease VII small subunit [Acidobacteriota bacterium]GIU81500.1 MAG: exodeoxyribonuclease 7 small subunit [Pyrinomonadaceae bacterium]
MPESFEESMRQLEEIVQKLEEGNLPLEESLRLFEEGIKLSRKCQERLDQIERRIELLLKDKDGMPFLDEFESDV